jgi:hypothetical protein
MNRRKMSPVGAMAGNEAPKPSEEEAACVAAAAK